MGTRKDTTLNFIHLTGCPKIRIHFKACNSFTIRNREVINDQNHHGHLKKKNYEHKLHRTEI